jgi:O-antigen ligase
MQTANKSWIALVRKFSLFGIAVSLAFSRLNLNSACIMFLLVSWLCEGNFKMKWQLLKKDTCFLGYLFYFGVLLAGMVYAPSFKIGWHYIESMLGFLIIPLIICCNPISPDERAKTMYVFIAALTLASLYCLVDRIVVFGQTGDTHLFFYHALLEPIKHHAIYFSGFVLIGIVYLMRAHDSFDPIGDKKWLRISWIAYLTAIMILLSSKLVLVLLLLYFLYSFTRGRRLLLGSLQRIILLILLAGIGIGLVTINNPVERRFSDIFRSNTQIENPKFSPATYFNGLEFRMLLWRITYEILNEERAWTFGVGPTNSQHYLDEKYLQLDLYAGKPGEQSGGYFMYNCHNQFLQTTLQSGVIGLIALVFLYAFLLIKAIQSRNEVFVIAMLFIFCFFLIESVLERQWGMLLFTWLVLLFKPPQNTERDLSIV